MAKHRLLVATFVLAALPTFCAGHCLIMYLYNIYTHDQQDMTFMSAFALFLCGLPLSLLWLALSTLWVRRRIREGSVARVYFCAHDEQSFVVWPPVSALYRGYYLLGALPLTTCLLLFALLRASYQPVAAPEPFPGAAVMVKDPTRGGGSGGTYRMRSSSYVVAQPGDVVRQHYERQLASFFVNEWAFEERERAFPTATTCLYTWGLLDGLFPARSQSFSIWICPQREGSTEVHTVHTWDE